VKIALRTVCSEDFVFARNLYFETMRGMIERLFGWGQTREERNFAGSSTLRKSGSSSPTDRMWVEFKSKLKTGRSTSALST